MRIYLIGNIYIAIIKDRKITAHGKTRLEVINNCLKKANLI